METGSDIATNGRRRIRHTRRDFHPAPSGACEQFTIQGMPKRSVHMPKRNAQKVG
jgi:hypothetical protein